MWLFPLVFFSSALIPLFERYPAPFLLLVDLPLFLLCFYVASKPMRAGRMTIMDGVLLILVLPFVFWSVLILGVFSGALLVTF